jgi:hypothetical protein
MAITHTFKGSKGNNGYGYFAFIKDGELCIGESWPNEGGITYQGDYAGAYRALKTLEKEAPTLYKSITTYYANHAEVTGTIAQLKPGDKFYLHGKEYMLIDLNPSTCFLASSGKPQTVFSAVDLKDYKVYCFMSDTKVIKEN